MMTAIGIALVVKGVLTVVTFDIKVPAGIFIPTLGVVTFFGRIVGLAVQYWQWKTPTSAIFRVCRGNENYIIPGVYAMVCQESCCKCFWKNRTLQNELMARCLAHYIIVGCDNV